MSQEKKEQKSNAYDLRAVLEEIELDLIRNLRRNMKRHEREEEKEGFRWEMWQKAKLRNLWKYRKQNQGIVGQHSKEIEELINKTLQESFNTAESLMSRLFSKIKSLFGRRGMQFPKVVQKRRLDKPARPEDDFFGVNEKKIDALQETAQAVQEPQRQPDKKEEGKPAEAKKEPDEPPQEQRSVPKDTEKPFKPAGEEKDLSGKDNDQKLVDLKKQVAQDMKEVQEAIWHRMDDIYRQTIYKAEMFMAAGAKTLDQAIDMATKEFLDGGINCIEYSNGRRVNITSYAEMALRTASQRATFLAEGKKRDEWGIHTIFVSAHANTCPKCEPWQGKVLVDDVFSHGTAKEARELGVPLLSTAIKAGLLHPNCRHTISTYFPGITILPVVPDAEKAVKTYEAEQQQRVLERKIRKWKRIAAGSMEPDRVNLANDRVMTYQRELRKHLEKHPELRRDYNRERTRDIPESLKSFKSSAEKLTTEEEGAVIRYVSPDSYVLNDKLRRRADAELTDGEREWIEQIDCALTKLPKYEGNLNRSVTFTYDDDAKTYFDSFIEGGNYIPNQYLSTTKLGMYNDSGQVQIFIQNAKKGRDLGDLGIEKEVLYPIGSEFKIIYKTQHDGKYWVLLEEV